MLTYGSGSTLYNYLDPYGNIYFIARVLENSYIALGYGSSMTNTDMVVWVADGESSYQTENWAIGHDLPATDSINVYSTTFILDGDTGYVNFTSVRAADPYKDSENGGSLGASATEAYIIPIDQSFDTIYAWMTNTDTLVFHDGNYGVT